MATWRERLQNPALSCESAPSLRFLAPDQESILFSACETTLRPAPRFCSTGCRGLLGQFGTERVGGAGKRVRGACGSQRGGAWKAISVADTPSSVSSWLFGCGVYCAAGSGMKAGGPDGVRVFAGEGVRPLTENPQTF